MELPISRIRGAAILVIGDEILSGRTQDTNTGYIARWLAQIGIPVREARVVPDIEREIVAAVRHLSGRYDYVFSTGGIGPTHDDITAECIAKAFGVPLGSRTASWFWFDQARSQPCNCVESKTGSAVNPGSATSSSGSPKSFARFAIAWATSPVSGEPDLNGTCARSLC